MNVQLVPRATQANLSLVITLFFILQSSNHWPVRCRPSETREPVGIISNGPGWHQKLSNQSLVTQAQVLSPPREPAECAVFADYGKNYLTPIDLIVKSSETNVVCIKARFAISIKVEEAPMMNFSPNSAGNSTQEHEITQNHARHTDRPILGYVPLEHVLFVEDSCPDSFMKDKRPTDGSKSTDAAAAAAAAAAASETRKDNEVSSNVANGETEKKEEIIKEEKGGEGVSDNDDELELIVTFECGKLSFTFKRDKSRVFVSAIRGMVKLDKRVVREFIAIRPMFLTSDLGHHFKYDDEIEVVSEVQSGAHILTAMFYFTEIEAFRDTSSRDFIKPPDEKSLPFQDELTSTDEEELGQHIKKQTAT